MTDRDEDAGGLRPGAARWLGLDVLCDCGHNLGMHQTPGMECAVMDCKCGYFRNLRRAPDVE
jgi:hypothetical protein